MSVVQYGDETLKMCSIRSWDMKPIFSDDGIDYLYHCHTIDITAMLAADLEANEQIDTVIRRVRSNLGCPRQPLTVYLGTDDTDAKKPPEHGNDDNDPPDNRWGHDGERMADNPDQWKGVIDSGINEDDSIADNGAMNVHSLKAGMEIKSRPMLTVNAPDIAGGPKVEDVSVTEIEGTRFAYLNCRIVAHQSHCESPPGILSNRWEVRHGLTQNRMTVLTITGTCVINPAVHATADSVRDTLIPPLPLGFMPIRADFALSSDGLRSNYTIVYEEKYQLFPVPFTSLEAKVSNSTGNGAVTQSEILLNGEAPKNVSKELMLERMCQIIMSRFDIRKEGDILVGANTEEYLFENRLSIIVRVLRKVVKVAPAAGQPIAIDPTFNDPVPGVKAFVDDMPSRGTAFQKAIAAVWKQCCTNAEATNAYFQSPGSIVPHEGGSLTFSKGELPPAEPNEISEQQIAQPYESFEQLIEYENVSGLHVLPLGQQMDGESSSGKPRTTVTVRLHQPYTIKKVRSRGVRYNEWPQIPSPETGKDSETTTGSKIETEAPELQADLQTYKFAISGNHTIVMDHEKDYTTERVVGGANPMYKVPVADTTVPTASFRDDLADDPDADD
jgi:hypothetical protein